MRRVWFLVSFATAPTQTRHHRRCKAAQDAHRANAHGAGYLAAAGAYTGCREQSGETDAPAQELRNHRQCNRPTTHGTLDRQPAGVGQLQALLDCFLDRSDRGATSTTGMGWNHRGKPSSEPRNEMRARRHRRTSGVLQPWLVTRPVAVASPSKATRRSGRCAMRTTLRMRYSRRAAWNVAQPSRHARKRVPA